LCLAKNTVLPLATSSQTSSACSYCEADRTNFKPLLDIRIIITINPVKTQQFILLLSATCFGLIGHHQVEDKNKRKKM
jgi:hypothetical protein